MIYEDFIHKKSYARWLPDLGRRELWHETVDRYIQFWVNRFPELFENDYPDLEQELYTAIHDKHVMPSMRAMMTAGPALERDEVAGYNCAFHQMSRPFKFAELLYILMNGTGGGFSVERRYTDQLPPIPDRLYKTDTVIHVPDSKIGWAKAYKELLAMLWNGQIPKWDMSNVRPHGEPLKTFGGRASGPEPLESLFEFTVKTFVDTASNPLNVGESKLKPIQCHDLACKIAEVVVCGGVRRSALISLSDPDDTEMQNAKTGNWIDRHPYRAFANNSANWHHTPTLNQFLHEWTALWESHCGERGIFSTSACQAHVKKRAPRRDHDQDFGTNPCSEIILRDRQLCNLSEVIIRAEDSVEDIAQKVRLAAILGTLQSTLTNFRFLSNQWKRNCEEERLLGVSLTGICDNDHFSTPSHKLIRDLDSLKQVAITSNEIMAEALGINRSVAITCVKPSGTVSQLVNSASGIHPRYAKRYIRHVMDDKTSPLARFLIDNGQPYKEAPNGSENLVAFPFPIEAPAGRTAADFTALEQLELWKCYALHWAEHKPSITVYYKDEAEFLRIGAWLMENWELISGISFLPYMDANFDVMPYQHCSDEEFNELIATMPKNLDWEELGTYETQDNTTSSQELACVGNSCEII